MTNNKQYKQLFKEALKQQYVSAMFDIDGTLTEIGSYKIPDPLAKKLADLSLKIPLSFATGRNLAHVIGKIDQIIAQSKEPELTRKNWHITCENGAGGYFYDASSQKYEEFYRIHWDEDAVNREELKKALIEAIDEPLDDIEMRPTQLLIRLIREEPFDFAERAGQTARVTKIAKKVLDSFDGSDKFEVLDSQLAVHISPKNANKDQGIIYFAKLLEERYGFQTGENAEKILIIGDQPQPGRNDHALLKGEYGTPFTAEYLNSDSQFPIPIFDGEDMLTGPDATLHLLNIANFNLR